MFSKIKKKTNNKQVTGVRLKSKNIAGCTLKCIFHLNLVSIYIYAINVNIRKTRLCF